jgi:hypothetical protein
MASIDRAEPGNNQVNAWGGSPARILPVMGVSIVSIALPGPEVCPQLSVSSSSHRNPIHEYHDAKMRDVVASSLSLDKWVKE